jgi:hypothetical protein
MIAIKTMIAVSALASASALSTFGTLPDGDGQAAAFAERFAAGSQMLVPATKASTGVQVTADHKTDRLITLDKFCADQQWPYIAPECLVAGKGTAVRQPARFITVERRNGDGTATVRVPLATLAQR